MTQTHRNSLDRRSMIGCVASLAATAVASQAVLASPGEDDTKSKLGLVAYTCGLRRKQLAQSGRGVDLFRPLAFLQHCEAIGAGGIQASLGVLDRESIRELRDYAERHQLYVEAIVSPPKAEADCSRFTAEILTAAEVGALVVRTVVMPGRRYEQFRTLAELREAEAQAEVMLKLAAPIVAKHRVRLAVENHKDQRLDERVALHKRFESESIGACVDTGNSFALLDDPYDVVEALAPYALTVHLKDQAVRENEEGFLLGDIPLGQGCFDLRRMVDVLRRAKPSIRFNLELITRDPLRVTCLTDQYWITMPDMAGSDLARTLRIVKAHAAKNLQQPSSLSLDQQVVLEDANIAASLQYARAKLGF